MNRETTLLKMCIVCIVKQQETGTVELIKHFIHRRHLRRRSFNCRQVANVVLCHHDMITNLDIETGPAADSLDV